MLVIRDLAWLTLLSLGCVFCFGCGGNHRVEGVPATQANGQRGAEEDGKPEAGVETTPSVRKPGLKTLRPMARSGASSYSPDGKWFVIGADDLRVFQVASRSCVDTIPVGEHPVVALDFSDDGSRIAVGFWNYSTQENIEHRGFEIVVLSFPEGKELKRFAGLPGHPTTRRRLAFSPDGKLLADGYGKTVQVRSIESGEVTWELTEADLNIQGHSYASFDVTPDWKYFLVNLQRVAYPSKETIPMVKFLDQDAPFFWENLISPDGKRAVAMGGPNGSIQKLFDLETGKLIHEVTGVSSRSITASSDFKYFVNAQGYWDAESGKQHKLAGKTGSSGFTRWTSISPNNKEATIGAQHFQLANAGGEDQKATYWGDTVFVYRSLDVAFNSDGKPVIQAARKQRKIDLKNGEIGEVESAPSRSMFSNDLTKFGTFPRATSPSKEFTCDKVGWLNNAKAEFKKYLFKGYDSKTRPKSGQPFFPDNDTLVFLGGDKVFVFNTAGELKHTVDFPVKDETAMIVSSTDAQSIAVSQGSWKTGHRRYVSVLNIAEGSVTMPAVELGQCKIEITTDGQYVATIGKKWVNVYSTKNGELAHEFRLISGNASKTTRDPASSYLYVSTDNATIEVLDLKAGNRVAIVAARGKGSLVDNLALIRESEVKVAGDAVQLFGPK